MLQKGNLHWSGLLVFEFLIRDWIPEAATRATRARREGRLKFSGKMENTFQVDTSENAGEKKDADSEAIEISSTEEEEERVDEELQRIAAEGLVVVEDWVLSSVYDSEEE
jgi:hypothetical protein